jgi:23S rRNA pseudouridine1911/1915/1917 synthase
VNRSTASTARVLAAGDEVTVTPATDAPRKAQAATLSRQLRVLWRGDDLWALAKPAGLHTHRGRSSDAVADVLVAMEPGFGLIGPAEEAGLVHRLDKDTSGILLAAADVESYRRLRDEFAARRVRKRYWALVAGTMAEALVTEQPLARRRTRVVPARRHDRALDARSSIRPLETGSSWSLVEVEITTGVTHQVRAHLSLCGHPILGDAKYGGPPSPSQGRAAQLLHACSITLADGRSFAAPATEDFLSALATLRAERST